MYAIRSRARETINLHRIQQIKPVEFEWATGSAGQLLTSTGTAPTWSAAPVNTIIPGVTFQQPTNAFTFNAANNKPVLVITTDGDVQWHGKPSEAADCLVRTFQFAVENKKGVTKAARRRYYRMACRNILNKAETMEHNKFLDFLQKQVYNRERREILDALKGEENESIN